MYPRLAGLEDRFAWSLRVYIVLVEFSLMGGISIKRKHTRLRRSRSGGLKGRGGRSMAR